MARETAGRYSTSFLRKVCSRSTENVIKMGTQGEHLSVRKSVNSGVEAPKLKGVPTCQFTEFKRLTGLYAMRIAEKARNLKEGTVLMLLKASPQDDDLGIFIADG